MEIVKKISQHNGALYSVCYAKSLNLIFTAGADKIVASWDAETFENTSFSIKTQSAILCLSCIAENYLFIGLFNGHFHIVDLKQKKEIKYVTKHQKGIFSSFFDETNKLLIVGSGDGKISVWDVPNFNLLFEHKIANGKVRAIECIGNQAYIGNSAGTILQVNLESFQLENKIVVCEDSITSVCYLPQKNVLVIGSKNAWMYILDLNSMKIIHSIPAHNWAIYKILHTNSKIYTCSRDKVIKEWDADTLEIQQRYCWPAFKGHTHSINSMIYLPNLEYLVSIGDDKSLIIWK